MTRQAVAKHLAVLRDAGLVTCAREGREARYAPAEAGLEVASRWLADAGAQWDRRLARLAGRANAEEWGLLISRLLKTALALLIVAVLTPIGSAGTLLWTFLFMDLPARVPDRPPPTTSQISRVYDLEGNEIATFRQFETSIPVTQEDIPQVVKDAVIAAEDRNFYEHGGVDLRGTMRALWADVREGEAVQGGSTITQQLVKNTQSKGDRTVAAQAPRGDPREPARPQLEQGGDPLRVPLDHLPRRGVLRRRGGGRRPTSARTSAISTSAEAALLAGLIPAPSRYSPRVNVAPRREQARQVLEAMLEEGMISQGRARPVLRAACLALQRRTAAWSRHRRLPARGAALERARLHRLRHAVPRGAVARW